MKNNISYKYSHDSPKFTNIVYLINKKIFFVSKYFNNPIIIGTGNNIIQTKLYKIYSSKVD